MSRIYECMFLIDNDAVRASWSGAKSTVADLVAKHGGKVLCGRRWDERRLAYPIRRRQRATYLLTYCELTPPTIPALNRDLEISETVLRHLMLAVEAVPEKERELAALEDQDGFAVPEPPADDAVDRVVEPEPTEGRRDERRDGERKAESEAADKPAADKPAAEGEGSAETAEPVAATPSTEKKEG